jgi:hypothetical protein
MRQHEEKSEEVSTAAVVVAMSAPLQKSSMMSTPLEMSTVTSQAEERHHALDSFDLLQAQGKQAQSGLESFPPRVRHRARTP